MAQEGEIQISSNNNSSGVGGGGDGFSVGNIGRSSKKQKQKKVPQRGLGVAQLEKIRLEEQKKDRGGDSIILPPPPPPAPPPPPSTMPSSTKAQALALSNALSIPNYQSFAPPIANLSSDLTSLPNSVRSLQNVEIVNPNSNVQFGWQSNFRKMRNQENCGVDHGLLYGSSFNLSYDSHDSVWPLPIQRGQQYQQNLCSTMANMSTATSSSSSLSMLNIQMEPPSNQSFCSKHIPFWPEEEKMVGMKRLYPFSLGKQPGQSFQYKFPHIDHRVNNRSDEFASFGNEVAFNFNPGTPVFREGLSCSNSTPKLNSKKRIKENGSFDGDFLTLAPPTPTKTGSIFKQRGSSASIIFHGYQNFDFDSLNYQVEDQILQPGLNSRTYQHQHHHQQQQPFYSFLPQLNMQIDHQGINGFLKNCNGGEVGDNVIDLNLKL